MPTPVARTGNPPDPIGQHPGQQRSECIDARERETCDQRELAAAQIQIADNIRGKSAHQLPVNLVENVQRQQNASQGMRRSPVELVIKPLVPSSTVSEP